MPQAVALVLLIMAVYCLVSMPPLEISLIVCPVLRSKDVWFEKLIPRHIPIGFADPESYDMLVFSFQENARDYLRHGGVSGGKT